MFASVSFTGYLTVARESYRAELIKPFQSLFGMNVDILKDNPDWRWYILFGGAFLILTLVGWLVFKYTQVRYYYLCQSLILVLTNDAA